MSDTLRMTKVFQERVDSLLKDGYCKRVDTRLPHLWLVRMKHMANGNEILLKGYPSEGLITQQTNHITTHSERI